MCGALAPSNPTPADQATNITLKPTLQWTSQDPGSLPMTYDLYFGTSANPPLLESNQPASGLTQYKIDWFQLAHGTQYYWRVVLKNVASLETSGPVWSFTTGTDLPPLIIVGYPNNGDVKVRTEQLNLQWRGVDYESQTITYDVYFGTGPFPPLIASNFAGGQFASYPLPTLSFLTTYSWRIVARDSAGHETSGPLWTFTTKAQNEPPSVPFYLAPTDGAVNVIVNTNLSWSCSDPEGQPLTFDVYLGTNPSPPLVANNLSSPSYRPAAQSYVTKYWWRVVARDATGLETSGPTFSYTTNSSIPPTAPSDPLPANNTENVPINTTLSFVSSDPDYQPHNIDVYFGTTSFPALVASHVDLPDMTYHPGGLLQLTTYRWRIVARDPYGSETSGPLWTFKTGTTTNFPPTAVSNPTPPDNGPVLYGEPLLLKWTASVDPDGDPITYKVYIAQQSNLVVTNTATTTSPEYLINGGMGYGSFVWWVVATDTHWNTKGPMWHFTIGDVPPDPLPKEPFNPSPARNALGVGTDVALSWSASDPDGQGLKFDVYFGSGNTSSLVASNIVPMSYDPGPLEAGVWYSWRIVSRDHLGVETSGPGWRFFTGPPDTQWYPSNPSPPDNGSTSNMPTLSWVSSGFFYKVYLGPSPGSMALIATTTVPHCSPGFLASGRYYWVVQAWNLFGSVGTQGPTWSFQSDSGLPVAFSRFDATSSGSGVDVRWELSSDEDVTDFTLYRRADKSSQLSAVTSGEVTGATGSFLDASVEAGKTYHYELLVRTADGDEFRSAAATVTMPALTLTLHQNTPNPFNPQTTIRYDLPTGSTRARLSIFDATGGRVRTLIDEVQSGGSRSVIWNGRDDNGSAVSSGVYFYVLDAGKERLTRKLVLLK